MSKDSLTPSDEPTKAVPQPGSADGSDASTRAMRRVGPYVIESLLGRGGMGEVWRTRDTRLDRAVALKTITKLRATLDEADDEGNAP